MEKWEAEAYFFDMRDWRGLVEYRKQKADSQSDNLYDQWSLGEAYVLNEEYEKAISFLSNLHKKYADDPNIQYSLVEALLAVGKDENAIDWVIKPAVLKLDKDTLDYCYSFLRTKRKPRTVSELYLGLYSEGYPMFNDDQLMLFLHSDNRFILTGSETKSYECIVTIKRKKL